MLRDQKPRGRTRIGADVVCEALLRQGADVLFGYPGGVILPLYDVFGDYPDLRHVLVRHEQGAAHAADGFARATGHVGVCLGTSGPGATNLVTGLATAQLDSVPVVAITGNVPAALIGKDAFQEIDITGITLPMTKHNYLVRDADELPRVLAEAFHIARTGRPGPVHVDITKDALQQETQAPHPTDGEVSAGLPGFKPTFDGHPRQLKMAAQQIDRAERPVILAGHGILVADAVDELRAFAEKAQIPVAWTLLGVGAIDERHPLAYGFMGMHGWKHVNRAIQSADLLIALGMRFDDRVTGKVSTYAPGAKIVHVDIDPGEIGKNVAVEVPIVGDVGRVIAALRPLVAQRRAEERRAYFDELAAWRRESEASSWHGSGAWRDGLLSADYVVNRLGELTGHEATLVADVGQHQMWLARYAGFRRPNSHLSSGGLGTMGFAVPAAMGAALGRPDHETWAVCGDGGFQMTLQELATLVQDRIPVKIALMDNKKLGMIRQWQEIIYGGNYHSAQMFGPDYLKLCEAYGIPAFKASTPDEVDPAIEAARAVDGPAFVWFEIAEAQNVFPMMPAGKGLSDLIEKWGGADE
ncbi:MAG: biosynthetic-type acetolactate synthase large subunit [Chloroflexi bacterium]|nr:biosynthetic-type acetolactate synthase large subunit [Chloroflexota bacterium]